MSDIELKSCPFCGNRGAHEKNCYINLCFESEVLDADIPWEVMAKAWNQRAERTCRDIADHNELWFLCSECGYFIDGIFALSDDINYCPSCGAKVVE